MILVKTVDPGSVAEEAGFAVGDRIHSINGNAIDDLIDFQVHSSEQTLLVEVEREEKLYEVEVERSQGKSLGLDFEEMRLRRCNNNCVFCFIHQMPQGMRSSLYFEDDDYRLSFLHGSYVTLTNVKEKDIERIIEYRLSPQYISVHSTDPQLRQVLLGRRLPVDILERIGKLAAHQIEMHAQVVICPGLNDGIHLERTVNDLARFYPVVRSVAVVPVGLTRFRQHLPLLEPVTGDRARKYCKQVAAWGDLFQQNLGERFVYAADELFLQTGQLPPQSSYYDAFPQIENGIGMVRSFLDCWDKDKALLPDELTNPLHLAMVTGELAVGFMRPIVDHLNSIQGLLVDLLPVTNDFFGRGITVSGLLCGEDLLNNIEGGPWNLVLLPPNCINGDGLTLDDKTVSELGAAAGVSVTVGSYNLAAFLKKLLDGTKILFKGSGRQLSELGFTWGRKL